MRGALQRGQPACLVTPSHLNVAGQRSLKRRLARLWNFCFPPSCVQPQEGSGSLSCPSLRRIRADPQPRWPGGQRWRSPARGGRLLLPPHRGSLESVSLPLLHLRTHLGIIKSALGKKRTSGASGSQTWTLALAEGCVMHKRMVANYGNQISCTSGLRPVQQSSCPGPLGGREFPRAQ